LPYFKKLKLFWVQVKAEQDNRGIEELQKHTIDHVEHPTGGTTASEPKDVPEDAVPIQEKGSNPL
jgi:hypothetical protein